MDVPLVRRQAGFISVSLFGWDRKCGVTFVLLLHLLVTGALTEVRQDLSQLRDHNVIGCQSGLSLKHNRITNEMSQIVNATPRHKTEIQRYSLLSQKMFLHYILSGLELFLC